jgi:hypothetical protein
MLKLIQTEIVNETNTTKQEVLRKTTFFATNNNIEKIIPLFRSKVFVIKLTL